MAWGKGMTDMSRSTEEKISAIEESMPVPVSAAEYPWGLTIRLSEKELEKLGLSDDVEAGDTLHFMAQASVKSVSKNDYNGVKSCNVELQIEKMAAEDDDDMMTPSAKRYGGSKG